VLAHIGEEYTGSAAFVLHGLTGLPVWFALAGLVTAWFLYIKQPDMARVIKEKFRGIYTVLTHKYGFDDLYRALFAGGSRRIGKLFWKNGDVVAIDGIMVNGTANMIGWVSGKLRKIQSGYLYDYAFTMIIGLVVLLGFFVVLQ
jgi:NADH-quinone oxidoreductase subunit L